MPTFLRRLLLAPVPFVVFAGASYAELPPIMNPPNAQWYLWSCYGTSTQNGQNLMCGQAYGYNDYWARLNCSSAFYDIKCWPTGL